mgnify:CR=1 FL=1
MSGARPFFDTNVVLYLLSGDRAKADRAEALLAEGGVISVQVLNEFVAVARRKSRMGWPEVNEVLQILRSVCALQPLGVETHELALVFAERYGFSIHDAMILAAAELAGCGIVYTEDLQHQQLINQRLTVINPFLE